MRIAALLLGVFLVGCGPAPVSQPVPPAPETPKRDVRTGLRSFDKIVGRMQPVMRRACQERGRNARCDFAVFYDDNPRAGVNAYQTVNREGQPVIVFTLGLIAEARNDDELAFVLGHEAAHHIEGHLQETQMSAQLGAILLGTLAQAATSGSSSAIQSVAIDAASQAGAFVGSRQFSKQNELEADALGTVITARSGYDPVRGAVFFQRLPDPGNQFLGSHPPNAERIETVRRVAAGL